MSDLISILIRHAERYRLMQPQDAVKLLYQNEFGGGHLISDEDACRFYLTQEYANTPHDPTAALYEDIGNGVIRVSLAALSPSDLMPLADDFIRSAAEHTGSMPSFLKKLDILRDLTARGTFSFDLPTLEAYLRAYTQAGCPVVSHSEIYRRAYHPAYRIVVRR